MKAPSQTYSVIHKSSEANCYLSPFGVSASLRTSLVSWVCCVWSWKNAKSRKEKKKKRKERKRKSTQTQLTGFELALLRSPPPDVSFPCLKRHHTATKTKYKIRSISEYHVKVTRPTVWKRNAPARFQMQMKVKEVKLIVQISFAEKN